MTDGPPTQQDFRNMFQVEKSTDIDRRFREIINRVRSRAEDDPLKKSDLNVSRTSDVGSAPTPTSRTAFDETKQMMDRLRATMLNLSEQIDETLPPPPHSGPAQAVSSSSTTTTSLYGMRSPLSTAAGSSPQRRLPTGLYGGAHPMGADEFRHTAFSGLRSRADWGGSAFSTLSRPPTTEGHTVSSPSMPAGSDTSTLSNLLAKQRLHVRYPHGVESSQRHSSPSPGSAPSTLSESTGAIGGPDQMLPSTYSVSTPTSAVRPHSTLVVSSILQELEEDRARVSNEAAALARENAQLKDNHLKNHNVVEHLQHSLHTTESKIRVLEQELLDNKYELSCVKQENEQLKKRNDLLAAELNFVRLEKKDEVEQERNTLAFLQHEKERMQNHIELLKHNIKALLDISRLNADDMKHMGVRVDGDVTTTPIQADPKLLTTGSTQQQPPQQPQQQRPASPPQDPTTEPLPKPPVKNPEDDHQVTPGGPGSPPAITTVMEVHHEESAPVVSVEPTARPPPTSTTTTTRHHTVRTTDVMIRTSGQIRVQGDSSPAVAPSTPQPQPPAITTKEEDPPESETPRSQLFGEPEEEARPRPTSPTPNQSTAVAASAELQTQPAPQPPQSRGSKALPPPKSQSANHRTPYTDGRWPHVWDTGSTTQHDSPHQRPPEYAPASPSSGLSPRAATPQSDGEDVNVYTHNSDDLTVDEMSDVGEMSLVEESDHYHTGRSNSLGPAPRIPLRRGTADTHPRRASSQPPAKRSQEKQFCSACGQEKISHFTVCPEHLIAHPPQRGTEPRICRHCTVPASPERGVQSCQAAIREGYPIIKYNLSNAQPTPKWVRLEGKSLQWASSKKSERLSCVYLETVLGLTYNFEYHPDLDVQPALTTSRTAHLRFSLMVRTKKGIRSVDFEVENKTIFSVLFIGLHSLVYPHAPPMTLGKLLWRIARHLTTRFGKRAVTHIAPWRETPGQPFNVGEWKGRHSATHIVATVMPDGHVVYKWADAAR